MVTGPGDVTAKNDTGLWLANGIDGKLALREGQMLEVGGQNRKVKAIHALNLPNGAAGHGFGATAGARFGIATDAV